LNGHKNKSSSYQASDGNNISVRGTCILKQTNTKL
jgi:hypothetical protein